MSEQLIRAYRRTLFRVFDLDGEFVMRIDVPCPELLRCHARHGVSSSCFITAWNPASVEQPPAVNAAAQERLRRAITEGGYPMIEGHGEDPDSEWTPEASLLVLGIDETGARRFGQEFGQLAIVVAGPDATPRLVWLGSEN